MDNIVAKGAVRLSRNVHFFGFVFFPFILKAIDKHNIGH